MQTNKRFFTVLTEEDGLKEREPMYMLVPESKEEAAFMIDWIKGDLKEDLGGLEDIADYNEQSKMIERFYGVAEHIRHVNGEQFVFDPTDKGGNYTNEDYYLYIHPYFMSDDIDEDDSQSEEVEIESDDEDPEGQHFFELVWEHRGVACSLHEESVIEKLMSMLK